MTTPTLDELRKVLDEHRRTVVVALSQHAQVAAALADTPLVDVVASPACEPGRACVVNPSALRRIT